jgi:hypothetical protein
MAPLHSRQVRQLKKEGLHAPYTPAGTKEKLPTNTKLRTETDRQKEAAPKEGEVSLR